MAFDRLLEVWEQVQRRREVGLGTLAVVLASSLAPRKNGKWKIGDFLPWGEEARGGPREQTIEEQRKIVGMLRTVFGDKRDRQKAR